MVFSHFLLIWCHIDPGINMCLSVPLCFFKSIILFFNVLFFWKTILQGASYSDEVMKSWLWEKLSKTNQGSLQPLTAILLRFTLCHLARSLGCLLAHYVPWDFPVFLYLRLLG